MKALNMAITIMYRSGYWVRQQHGKRLADLLFRFLASYATCADLTLRQGKRRYPMMPKCHMIAHCAFDLRTQSQHSQWVQNPLALTNQIQEDFIGRPARISRRVNIRSVHHSLLMRALIVYQESLVNSDKDARGMDGFSDL